MDDFYLEPETELDFNEDPVQPEDSYRYSDTLTLDDED